MGSEARRTTHDPRAEQSCPACGRPVGTTARRHKALGVWVPIWETQPCRNRDCRLFEGEPDAPEEATAPPSVDSAGAAVPHGVEPEGAEATTPHVTGNNGETGRSPATG
ncbi:hypothetical protein ABZZ37_21490 [Streptomyces sp. NPDC006464]|uniref:hypothetical protein n=1 Tax=unclassified Streptomyces TaxID=2593676 RepID=UPI0033A3EA60